MIEHLVYAILNERQAGGLRARSSSSTPRYSIPGSSRFRMNVFRQRGSVGAVLRAIPFDIPAFDTLGLPPS